MPDMSPIVKAVLDKPDARRAVSAYERLFSALHLLDRLPPELLYTLRDHIKEEYKARYGPMADFIQCYLRYIENEPLKEARARDRRLRFGISKTMDDYLLPPKKEN